MWIERINVHFCCIRLYIHIFKIAWFTNEVSILSFVMSFVANWRSIPYLVVTGVLEEDELLRPGARKHGFQAEESDGRRREIASQ